MSPRKPNMLEAFKRSAEVEKTRRDAEVTSPEKVSGPNLSSQRQSGQRVDSASESQPQVGVGGPFDALEGDETTPERAATPAPGPGFGVGDDVLGTAPLQGRGFSPRTMLLVVGILVAMVVVFQLGRDLGSSTEASEPADSPVTRGDDPRGSTERGSKDAGSNAPATGAPSAAKDETSEKPASAADLSDDDRAFLSLDNNWTVIAISFDNNERGRKLAIETYHHLRDQGLPAISPLTRGNYYTICVGAEPNRNAAIEKVRADLRKLAGPAPRNEKGAYSDAYFANIEDLVDPDLRN